MGELGDYLQEEEHNGRALGLGVAAWHLGAAVAGAGRRRDGGGTHSEAWAAL